MNTLKFLCVFGGMLALVVFATLTGNIALSVVGIVLGILVVIAGLFLQVNRPHHRVIIRNAFGLIVAWPDARLFLTVPLLDRLAEYFDLSWRFTELEQQAFTTMEGLQAHFTVRVGFTVDPARMANHLRQNIIDQMGSDAERWANHVQRLIRAGLNVLVHQQPYAELTDSAGHQALQQQLSAYLAQQLAGMGVTIVQVLILQISPSAQIVDIRTDMIRRRALMDFIATQLAPTLQLLTPYTSNPIEALTAIGMLDRLSNRSPGPVTLNVLSLPANGATPTHGADTPIAIALPYRRRTNP